jgi:hypothetical protein
MDYTDPADRRLRDEPTVPLSPEEAVIAANIYQSKVLADLMSILQNGNTPTLNLPNHNHHEKDPRNN